MAVSLLGLLAASCSSPKTTVPTTTSVPPRVSFPASIYPPAQTPTAGSGLPSGSCPNSSGLVQQPSASTGTFVPLVNGLAHATSLQEALTYLDQSLWPTEASSWSAPSSHASYVARDLQALPAWSSGSVLGSFISHACGTTVLNASWIVSYCFPATTFSTCIAKHPALTATTAYIERGSSWLVWYENSGYQGP